jgi:signal transduction histidine kinase
MSLHIQDIREEERAEVSKFVHDELGQTMTALKMNLVSLQGLIDKKNHKADQRIKESIRMVNSGLSAVHNLTGRLTPGIIQDLGLIPALEYEIEEFRQWSKLECELRTDIEDIGLEKDAATDIFRIIRELLTNAARHSEGTAVFIYMKIQDDLLHVRVRDNGKGASPGDLNAGDSFGIMNVKGRVRKNGGNIIFDTELSKGFEVRISFPLIEITK